MVTERMDTDVAELSDLQELRRLKAEQLRGLGMDPYNPRSSRTHTTTAVVDAFEADEARQSDSESAAPEIHAVTVAGRVVSRRDILFSPCVAARFHSDRIGWRCFAQLGKANQWILTKPCASPPIPSA